MQLQRYTTRYAEYIISCGPRCRKGQTINSKTVKETARRTKEMVGAFQTLQLRGAHLDSDDSEITVVLQSMGILSSLYKPSDHHIHATLKLLLKRVAPPFLKMARITKAKREITATINTDFGLVASEDGLSVSADPARQERKLLEGAPAPTSQEALFCAFIARCKENFEDLERFTANLSDYLRTIQEAKQGDCGEWVSPETRRHFEVEFYIAGDMKWLLTLAGQKGAMAKHFCFLCSCSYEDIGDFDLNWEIDRDNAEGIDTLGKKSCSTLFLEKIGPDSGWPTQLPPESSKDARISALVNRMLNMDPQFGQTIREGRAVTGFKIFKNRDGEGWKWHGLNRGPSLRKFCSQVKEGTPLLFETATC
eukprot:g11221.t1